MKLDEESNFFAHSVSPQSILRQLNEWRKVPLYCDVVLRFFNELFPVHGCVLAAASPFLKNCLEKSEPRIFSAAHPQVIDIDIDEPDLSDTKRTKYVSAMAIIITYLYTSNIDMENDVLYELKALMRCLLDGNTAGLICSSGGANSNCNVMSIDENDEVEDAQTVKSLEASLLPANVSTNEANSSVDKVNSLEQPTKTSEVITSNKIEDEQGPNIQDIDNVSVPEIYNYNINTISVPRNQCISKGQLKEDLKCPICSYECVSTSQLTSHIALHNDAVFSCDRSTCDFQTKKLSVILQHKKDHSELIKECPEMDCTFRTFRKKDLDQHIRKKHKQLKTLFPCPKCDKVCKTKNLLRLHLPIHSDERPYKCDKCPADFRWKNALKKHEIVHTRERNYLCDICGFSAAYRADLNAHSLIHTGKMFKCQVPGCKFQCIKKAFLTTHELTHNPEKLHQCEVCGQKFSLMKNLKRHMRYHTNYQPYKCEFCTYAASRSDKLREHVQRIHGIVKTPKPIQKHIPDDPETCVLAHVELTSSGLNSKTENVTCLPGKSDESTSGGDVVIKIDKSSVDDVITTISQLMTSPNSNDMSMSI